MALTEQMRRTNNMEVQYLACGIDVAAILKSLQEYVVKFDKLEGASGLKSGGSADFAKLEIVESYAISPDLIHLLITNPTLSQATLVMVTYKPLYVLLSVDNSIRRTFIKSRTWIGLTLDQAANNIDYKIAA